MAERPGERDALLGNFVRNYIDRVVNRRDVAVLDEFVSPDFVGSGPDWPTTIEELHQFYRTQMRERPDWHIDVQDKVELGDSVVVRALAGGPVTRDGASRRTSLEWLAHYRVIERRITEINVLAAAPLGFD